MARRGKWIRGMSGFGQVTNLRKTLDQVAALEKEVSNEVVYYQGVKSIWLGIISVKKHVAKQGTV